MWGCFRVGVLIIVVTGIAQRSMVSLAGPGAPALRALDKPAFTATPDELLALGKAAPTGDWSMVILRDQREVSYDDHGRATVRTRQVYVVQAADATGHDDDDAVHAAWHPSYQDRPVLRARVIAPAGTAAEVDPAKTTEPSPGFRPVNADWRYLTAPLPALEVGSVVEQEIVVRDRESPTGGGVDIAAIGNPVPTSSTVISYAAPVAVRLHHVERLLPAGAKARHQVAGGRETWSYEIAALPPRLDHELETPDDDVAFPYVGVSTGASWEAVARAYRKLVDQRIVAGPVDLPAELPHTASAEAVDAITAWVHHHVHRSGEGIDETIGVPRSPAETVKQAAGSGNDQATLLVALLRQAGLRADVALVANRGHVDADLPGMRSFDHAIVRVRIGGRELWIDPGEELARPGQLPARDQGRRALVIVDDTRALATTPRAASADNTVRDVRTFVASEDGFSRLTSVVRYTGAFEIEHRDRVRAMRADHLKKLYGASSESEFVGTLERFASSNAEDLAAPFEMTFEVKDVRVVATEVERIEAYFYPRSALDGLPWLVTNKPDASRGHDYVWPRPQVHEVENRIVIPPGYTPPVPGPDHVRSLAGGGTFTEHRELDDRTLIVRFRLDTGKPRITPAELAALQTALQEINQEVVHIAIDHTAFALVDAGKPREAIAECQRMIALHPAEPLHHIQLARVLLRVGAGEAARREARKAVAMAPGDAGALVGLGWTLSHDTLGRAFTYDWDRTGAIAALRQARKINPSYLGAPLTLAQALQHDPSGRMYDGADLAGAAEAWRATLALDKTDGHALALARVLFWSEQFAEAEKVARTTAASDERDRWIVAAVAGRGGAAPAIQAAGELRRGADRTPLLAFAGWGMTMLQRYDEAGELLSGSGALTRGVGSAAAMMAKLKRHPRFQLRPTDPRSVVQEMFLAQLDPQRKSPVFYDAGVERELRGSPAQGMPAAMRGFVTARWVSDLIQSTVGIEIEGGAGAWRAAVDDNGTRSQVYLVLDRGVVKLIGGSAAISGVGRYILRGGDARADERARRLLDWLRADVDRTNPPDAARFKQLWGQGIAPSHEAIQLAAAVLAGATAPDRVLPIAARCASTVPDAELACHEARFAAYRERGQWPEAVAESEAILALRAGPNDARAREHAWALARAGRFDEADRVLDAALARGGDRRDAMWGRFEVAAMRGSATEILQRGDALVNDPAAGPLEFNYVAWHHLGLTGTPGMPGDLTGSLQLARKAVDNAPQLGGVLNTLAALEAEHGELDRAIHDSWKAMELRNAIEPSSGDWYVIGRILEQLGLNSDAIAAYQRVTRPPEDEVVSAYLLAQRRLAVLGARP